MSEWITDRRPCESDADIHGYVWVTDTDGDVRHMMWDCVTDEPWMPFNRPEPYVKAKRWRLVYHQDAFDGNYYAIVSSGTLAVYRLPVLYRREHREAAERIAAIYEEMMP